jgi:hypothetical protein
MNLDPNAREGPRPGHGAGEAVALSYIDKVHASLTKQWDGMSRSLTAQAIVSLVTVAVSVGAVAPREDFSIFGVGLTASITTVLIGSAFLIATFHVMTLGSLTRAGETKMALTRLYMDLGYRDEVLKPESLEDPLGAATPAYTLITLWLAEKNQPQSWLARVFVAAVGRTIFNGLMFWLPVVAELVALLKVASLMGWWENWLWVVLIVPIVVSVICDIWTVEAARQHNPDVRGIP